MRILPHPCRWILQMTFFTSEASFILVSNWARQICLEMISIYLCPAPSFPTHLLYLSYSLTRGQRSQPQFYLQVEGDAGDLSISLPCGSLLLMETTPQTHLCTPRPWNHTSRSRSGRGGLGVAILLRDWRSTRWAKRYWQWGRENPRWRLQSEPSRWLSGIWPATGEERVTN